MPPPPPPPPLDLTTAQSTQEKQNLNLSSPNPSSSHLSLSFSPLVHHQDLKFDSKLNMENNSRRRTRTETQKRWKRCALTVAPLLAGPRERREEKRWNCAAARRAFACHKYLRNCAKEPMRQRDRERSPEGRKAD
jgi:hypothetical protein